MNRGWTRRELLAACGALPAALLAGCGADRPAPLPPGRLVGTSDVLGHQLRDGFRPRPPAEAFRDAGLVIVGGGVAGLSAAWRLMRAGFTDFVLLELEPELGGTARGGQSPVTAFPWGAHYICTPRAGNAPLVELLDEMGVLEGRDAQGEPRVAEQYLVREPEERVFFRGRWYEGLLFRAGASAGDLHQAAAFHKELDALAAWRDGRGRPAFALPLAHGSDDPEITVLDRLTMAEWLAQKGFTSPRLRWYVDYACRDDYGTRLEQTSAWAGLFYFVSRLPRPGAEPQPLIAWPEGNARLVNHLRRAAGERVRANVAVTEIAPLREAGGRERLEVLALDRASNAPVGFRARRVIFAAPQFLARWLIRPYRETPPAHLAEFEYGAWMVANLHLNGRPAERFFPLAWDNVLYDSPALGYVVATHQHGLDHGPAVFTYYHALCDADPKTARARLLADRDAWAEFALADLSRAHPEIRALTERLDVMRWGHAMVRARPGFIWGAARRKAAEPLRGIHFAHTDLSGIALFEEAFHHGLRAADEVLA